MLPISSSEVCMVLHVFVAMLVVFLLCLVRLWRLCWLHLLPSHSRGGAKHTKLHRLLKPRCPDDCPACRLASPASSGGEPAPAPVRPWCEVKSRRGARHPREHRGLCLSQSAVPVLRDHRCPRPRGFLAMASMVMPSRSRRFGARLATRRSVPGATRRCTG
jgi:hypothetical protein